MIELKQLYRRWGNFSLKDIDLKTESGEYFVLLGPCGAGKTLLLETIAGFHVPEGGEILINNRDVTNLPSERRGVGFVYQEHWLFPHLSVRDNICYGLKDRRNSKRRQQHRLDELTELLGLQSLMSRQDTALLSGGEKQKVALARALAPQPELLLLDEPLHSLDMNIRDQVTHLLLEINRNLGVTVLHVTHDFTEAAALARRIGIMNDGRLIQVGESEEILLRPQARWVADFLGMKNMFNEGN